MNTLYYDKLAAFTLITNSDHEKDPMVQFKKSYTILVAIKDVGQAWEEIPPTLYMNVLRKFSIFHHIYRKEMTNSIQTINGKDNIICIMCLSISTQTLDFLNK